MTFEKLGLDEALLRTVRDKKFTVPTTIQAQAIAPAAEGRDIFGCAQTGTGKTAAFALPIIQRLMAGTPQRGGKRAIRSLVLAPTRELAAQIGETFEDFGRRCGLRNTVIFGGVNQHSQCSALRRGVDVLIATPGRLLDLIGQGIVDLGRVEVLVLDEADRMLDMGFIHDIKRVVALIPEQRQTMFFSATMPKEIDQLAAKLLRDPVRIIVAPERPAAENVDHAVHFVSRNEKMDLLRTLLSGSGEISKAIVFTRTKHGADKVARKLDRAAIAAEAMHSGKSQPQRLRTLESFKSGRLRVLVASDIAARGIDVSDISHVFNYDLPAEAETYVHRIGRTGRAGLSGSAVSFCSEDERPLLRQVERLLTKPLPVAPRVTIVPEPVREPVREPLRRDPVVLIERRVPARSVGAKTGGAKVGSAKAGGAKNGASHRNGGKSVEAAEAPTRTGRQRWRKRRGRGKTVAAG